MKKQFSIIKVLGILLISWLLAGCQPTAMEEVMTEAEEAVELDTDSRYTNADKVLEYSVWDYTINKNWLYAEAPEIAGLKGAGRPMTAIRIDFPSSAPSSWHVKYRTNSGKSGVGWASWVQDGAESGDRYEYAGIEAVEVIIEGFSWSYRVRYQGRFDTESYSGWHLNGQTLGQPGQGKKLTEFQIKLSKAYCPKGSFNGSHCYVGTPPSGQTAVVISNKYYYRSPNAYCGYPSTWINGVRHCYVDSPPSGKTGFVWHNGWYYTPYWTDYTG